MRTVTGNARELIIRTVRSRTMYCLLVSAAVLGLLATNNAVAQTCAQPPPDMVSWWPGDGYAFDIQGVNNGTLQGGATFTAGKVGQAFNFDGVNAEVSIAHTSALNFGPNDSFSVDAWLKPSTSVLGTSRAAVSLTYVCSAEAINLGLLTDGRIDFGIRDNNNISVDVTSPVSIVDGQLHHVTVVRDVGSHTVKLYVDGLLVDSLPDTTTGTFTRADAQDRIGSIPVACPTIDTSGPGRSMRSRSSTAVFPLPRSKPSTLREVLASASRMLMATV